MKKTVLVIGLSLIALVIAVIALICTNRDQNSSFDGLSAAGSGETSVMEQEGTDQTGDAQSVEDMAIEQAYRKLLRRYLEFDQSVLDVISPYSALGEADQKNPFFDRTARLLENADTRTALAKAASALEYTVINSGYTQNSRTQSYAVELAITVPDLDRAIREHFIGVGYTAAFFDSDGIADFINQLEMDSLPRNSGYIYCFFEKASDGIWKISSISDPMKNALYLPEFGGIQLYAYDERAEQYPVYLPLGLAEEITEDEFITADLKIGGERGIDAGFQTRASECVNRVVSGLTEGKLNLVFTDNQGVLDAAGNPYSLEDSASGKELYREFQELEIDTEKAARSRLYLDFFDCGVKYYRSDNEGIQSYLILMDYTYLNKGNADKMLYGLRRKSSSSLSNDDYLSFVEQNKKNLLSSGSQICLWSDHEQINPDKMLINQLVTLAGLAAFGE